MQCEQETQNLLYRVQLIQLAELDTDAFLCVFIGIDVQSREPCPEALYSTTLLRTPNFAALCLRPGQKHLPVHVISS